MKKNSDLLCSSTLFPPIEPYEKGMLAVTSHHEIYYEVSGNPKGKPVIVVHGGPGGGTTPSMRQYFDPLKYKIILFDQRGCGKSKPNASLEENTSWDLVADMERIRTHLGVERWQVFGGSWGSTLGLLYGQTHPERVTEFVLRGIFTLRKEELDWFYQKGADWFFPDAWQDYCAIIPEDERDNMIAAYYKRLTSPDLDIQYQAARAWSRWEGGAVSLLPAPERVEGFGNRSFAIAFARIECHYFINGGFFEFDDQILRNINRVTDIPAVIVQGRYDVITPIKTAWELHQSWPGSILNIIDDAGHAASEPGIVSALVDATNKFASRTL